MTAQTHLPIQTLKGSKRPDSEVRVRFALKPAGKAVLFIHGFGGNPLSTWSDFQGMLPSCGKGAGHDIYFYGYDGLYAPVLASSAIFREFLDRLMTPGSAIVSENLPPSAQRDPTFAYQELVIVAHSLGAVISRRTLLDATDMGRPWPAKTRLVLYAPAHSGARVVELIMQVRGVPFLPFFRSLARLKSPLIDELTKNSDTLKVLLADTRKFTLGGANAHLIPIKVVLAETEAIVFPDRFGEDPHANAIVGTTHTTVCKPSQKRPEPLTELESLL